MVLGSFLLTLFLYVLTCSARAVGNVKSSLIPRAGSLEQITNFGSNPSNVAMYIYVPKNLASNPGIIVAIHYCKYIPHFRQPDTFNANDPNPQGTGTAQAYYNGSPYAQLAEKHGFIVIYPESPYSGKCWDVSSKATLTHNGGGNSNSIANMVTWTTSKYNANPNKVFVTGTSSGAMMTVRDLPLSPKSTLFTLPPQN
jgi:acetylxylan esterase